jgi:hypothetical protein
MMWNMATERRLEIHMPRNPAERDGFDRMEICSSRMGIKILEIA